MKQLPKIDVEMIPSSPSTAHSAVGAQIPNGVMEGCARSFEERASIPEPPTLQLPEVEFMSTEVVSKVVEALTTEPVGRN